MSKVTHHESQKETLLAIVGPLYFGCPAARYYTPRSLSQGLETAIERVISGQAETATLGAELGVKLCWAAAVDAVVLAIPRLYSIAWHATDTSDENRHEGGEPTAEWESYPWNPKDLALQPDSRGGLGMGTYWSASRRAYVNIFDPCGL
jgi:hypothetical protein